MEGGVSTSLLITSNPWVAVSDFLIKCRSAKKQRMSVEIIPLQKTTKLSNYVLYIVAFFKNKDGKIVKEVSIDTIATDNTVNKFYEAKTNDYYISEGYLSSIKKLASHIRDFKDNEIKGLSVLAVYAIFYDSHPIWELYTPSDDIDSLVLEANF